MTRPDRDRDHDRDHDRIPISAVVPLVNEAESLQALRDELVRAFGSIGLGGPDDFEVIFVDDGSRDDSWRIVEGMSRSDPRVRGLRFRRNFGKAAALSAGFRAARGEVVFTLDADLQDDPSEIPRFLDRLKGDPGRGVPGVDLVSGWKRTRHDPWHKVGPSRVFNLLVSRATGCHLHDHNCGFKAYRREVIAEVRLYGEMHRFVPSLAHARGFKVAEIEVHHRPRRFGRSKYGAARFVKGLLDLSTVLFLGRYGQRPLHALGGAALGLAALSGLGLVAAAIARAARWIDGLDLLALLVASALAASLALGLFGLGLVAELVVANFARFGRTFETFRVAEATAPAPRLVDATDPTLTTRGPRP